MSKRNTAQALPSPITQMASKNDHLVKTAEALVREAYTRTENLLQLNERKIRDSFRLNDDGQEVLDMAARDLRIFIQNIQDLQQDLQRFSDAVHGRNVTENPLASRNNPLLELILNDLAERFRSST